MPLIDALIGAVEGQLAASKAKKKAEQARLAAQMKMDAARWNRQMDILGHQLEKDTLDWQKQKFREEHAYRGKLLGWQKQKFGREQQAEKAYRDDIIRLKNRVEDRLAEQAIEDAARKNRQMGIEALQWQKDYGLKKEKLDIDKLQAEQASDYRNQLLKLKESDIELKRNQFSQDITEFEDIQGLRREELKQKADQFEQEMSLEREKLSKQKPTVTQQKIQDITGYYIRQGFSPEEARVKAQQHVYNINAEPTDSEILLGKAMIVADRYLANMDTLEWDDNEDQLAEYYRQAIAAGDKETANDILAEAQEIATITGKDLDEDKWNAQEEQSGTNFFGLEFPEKESDMREYLPFSKAPPEPKAPEEQVLDIAQGKISQDIQKATQEINKLDLPTRKRVPEPSQALDTEEKRIAYQNFVNTFLDEGQLKQGEELDREIDDFYNRGGNAQALAILLLNAGFTAEDIQQRPEVANAMRRAKDMSINQELDIPTRKKEVTTEEQSDMELWLKEMQERLYQNGKLKTGQQLSQELKRLKNMGADAGVIAMSLKQNGIKANAEILKEFPYIRNYLPVQQSKAATLQEIQADYGDIIKLASKKHRIPPNLILAIIYAESAGDPVATSSAGARGLMQLMPTTAKELGVDTISNPKQNIEAGTKYLAKLYKQFGSIEKALAAYNFGPARIAKRKPLPKEVKDYVKKVLKIKKYLDGEQNAI